jgi:hypothetical protein
MPAARAQHSTPEPAFAAAPLSLPAPFAMEAG